MNSKAIEETLNRILLLEKSQVALYTALAAKAPDEELIHGLKRLAKIENEHVKAVEDKLKSLFSTPADVVNHLKDTVIDGGLKVFGSTVSAVQDLTGLIPLLKTASAAEEKAMAEYRQTIAYIKDFELRDLFWEHLIDEELHSLWLAKKAEELN